MLPKRESGLGKIISPMTIKSYVRPLWKDQGLKIGQVRLKILLTLEITRNNGIMLKCENGELIMWKWRINSKKQGNCE